MGGVIMAFHVIHCPVCGKVMGETINNDLTYKAIAILIVGILIYIIN